MKRIAIFTAAVILSLLYASPAFAIEDPDPKGTLVTGLILGPRTSACLELYVDIDEYLDIDIGSNGGFMLGVEPMLTADYVLVDSWWKGHFTVGAMLGGYKIGTMGKGEKRHHSAIVLAPRAMYGLNLSRIVEVHAGFITGLAIKFCSVHAEGDDGASFVFGTVTGARFNLSDHFGITADLNLSAYTPLASVGVSYKF